MKRIIPDQHMKHTSSSANSRLLNRSEIIPGIPCDILLEASNSFSKKCTVTCEQSQLRSRLLRFTVNSLKSMPSGHCHRVPCQTHPNSRLTQSTTSPSRECMLDQPTLCHIPERDQGVQNNTATTLDFPFWLCALPILSAKSLQVCCLVVSMAAFKASSTQTLQYKVQHGT